MSATLVDIFAPFPAKRLARASGAHPKTAARWRTGDTAPSAEAFIRMMTDDDLFEAILAAAGRADLASRLRAAEHLMAALRDFGGKAP